MSSAKMNWKISEFVAHADDILCAALNPSTGRTLATGGEDNRVNLWLVGQPHNITSISGLTSPVDSVVFNNSEEWLGAGSRSGTLKVFDLNESKVVRSISGHKASIKTLDFHRYGDILATGSMDTNIKLWDVRKKGCLYTYKRHEESINCLQFSPDGKWLVSGSSDCNAKIWDLTAAKCLHDFSSHSGAINDMQFHPKELLLAIASSDRTVSYWDLEDFSLVSLSSPEASPIRRIMFHPSGDALFTGSQDSLRVHEWEPSNQLDYLPVAWGKVADMQLSGDQLIGVSFVRSTISTWCVDMNSLKPWGGGANEKKGCASARRHFNFQEEAVPERPPTQPSGPPPPRLESNGEVGGDSPPTEVTERDRMTTFKSREQLVRTPPKQVDLKPFLPPIDKLRLFDDNFASNVHYQPSKPIQPLKQVQPIQLPPQPRGRGHCVTGYREIYRDVTEAHYDVSALLGSRLDILQQARSQWSVADARGGLEVVINSGNQSAIVDMLNLLNLKRSLWSLDMAVLVLPELRLLLRSNHQNYIECSVNTLKLILKSFSSLIVTHVHTHHTPLSAGVDFAHEERMEKCQVCYSHLLHIRQDLINCSPLLSKISSKLNLNDAFSLLD